MEHPDPMGPKTKAAVLFETNQPLRIVDLAIPELKPGQVMVKISYSGICHSQLLEIQGKRGKDPYLPHTLGHEGSGVVQGVGPGVTKVKRGDPVVLSWIKGEGGEVSSTVYKSESGPINSGAISTLLETAVVSENRVTPISPEMPLREASLLGCAIPTGAGAVLNLIQSHSRASVGIFGVGGIGMGAVLGAQVAMAKKVFAIDIHQHKLQRALSLGATHAINARVHDPVVSILEHTDGIGVDLAIEAAGRHETMEAAFRSVRKNGGLCILAGNLARGERISIDPFDLILGKRIVGTWGGETLPARDFPFYVNLFLEGRLKLELLITHTYGLHEVNHAFADLSEGRVGRAIIEMNNECQIKG